MAVWSTKSEDTTFNVMAVIVNRFPSRPIILNITVMTPLMVEVNSPYGWQHSWWTFTQENSDLFSGFIGQITDSGCVVVTMVVTMEDDVETDVAAEDEEAVIGVEIKDVKFVDGVETIVVDVERVEETGDNDVDRVVVVVGLN